MIAVVAVAVLTLRAGFNSKKARNNAIELLSSKKWIMNALIVIGFIIYIIYETRNNDSEDSKKTKEALKG